MNTAAEYPNSACATRTVQFNDALGEAKNLAGPDNIIIPATTACVTRANPRIDSDVSISGAGFDATVLMAVLEMILSFPLLLQVVTLRFRIDAPECSYRDIEIYGNAQREHANNHSDWNSR